MGAVTFPEPWVDLITRQGGCCEERLGKPRGNGRSPRCTTCKRTSLTRLRGVSSPQGCAVDAPTTGVNECEGMQDASLGLREIRETSCCLIHGCASIAVARGSAAKCRRDECPRPPAGAVPPLLRSQAAPEPKVGGLAAGRGSGDLGTHRHCISDFSPIPTRSPLGTPLPPGVGWAAAGGSVWGPRAPLRPRAALQAPRGSRRRPGLCRDRCRGNGPPGSGRARGSSLALDLR